ncbi:Cell death protease [Coemansia erecta]|uniref:Ribokinase n=1 Tax=Coemansia erecta TaxID=147472 RepID=A0A9W7XX77_9FUNG|nr:Cell death protease [Coemansia erecta]
MHPEIYSVASINIDEVYSVPHIARAGETLSSTERQQNAGGKGANASIAAARSGATVHVVGKVGEDGRWLCDLLQSTGAHTEHIAVDASQMTGRAIIQVDAQGENSIVLFPGANQRISGEEVGKALGAARAGDWLMLTNETSAVAEAMEVGRRRGLRVLWNPAPMQENAGELAKLADVLVVNQTELQGLAGYLGIESADDATMAGHVMQELTLHVLAVTLGSAGCLGLVRRPTTNAHEICTEDAGNTRQAGGDAKHKDDVAVIHMECAPVGKEHVRDTTGAGDTWVGYFAAELARAQGDSPESIGALAELTPMMVEHAMRLATYAAGLAVTRMGAVPSIPERRHVDRFLRQKQLFELSEQADD